VKELPQTLFDVYALALPRGHGFGERPPIEGWQTEDGNAYGVVTCEETSRDFGILVIRRRIDQVWTVTQEMHGLPSRESARSALESHLVENAPAEPLPPNTGPRPALHDLAGRTPSDIFRALFRPTHYVAAWTMNQLYLALPSPDPNWAADCQTTNFHTRLWEAQLLASFREQGLLVTQPYPSPDFRIENRHGGAAWVEAVTANPPVPYNHVNSPPSLQPADKKELFLGPAALRFAKTLGSKLQRNYDQLQHVRGMPFALALADFHAPAAMVWSREALPSYLYGFYAETEPTPALRPASTLLGDSEFPAGLFSDDRCPSLSAVIFSNACSIAKLNRVPISAGAHASDFRYVRIGNFFDRNPGAFEGIPFCLEITSQDYRNLWPQRYEPWTAELEVLHNPFARHPLPHDLLPEATHWFDRDGEIVCESHYETSILWSVTRVLNGNAPIPTMEEILAAGQADPD
jgi:hypothetical protein